MDRQLANILVAIVWLGYIAIMAFLMLLVGFEDKGSWLGYIIIAPMMFMPFASAIEHIRAEERRNLRRRK